MRESIINWTFVFLAIGFDCYTLVIVKYRFNQIGQMDIANLGSIWSYVTQFLSVWWIWTGAVTFILGPMLGYVGINRLPVTLVYPTSLTLHVAILFIASVIFLNEHITVYKIVGTVIMLAGLYIYFWE